MPHIRHSQAALAEQLGAPEGIKINIEAPAAPSPSEPGGSTWRKAYEAPQRLNSRR